MWYDNNPKKPVSTKIDEAVVRFIQRYGRTPDVCMMNDHETLLEFKQPEHAPDLRVLSIKTVPTHYFWVGCEAA